MTSHPSLKAPTLRIMETYIAASLVTALAPAALAQNQDPTVIAGVAHVPYGDLDLASPAGEKVLTSRVWRAAKKLCKPNASLTDIVTQACVRNAYHDARPQILSAIARARNPSLAALSGSVGVRVR
ncbi:UrcA family protein [Allosphingosinicella humi]